MQAILDRIAAEDAGLPDPMTLPLAEGRALSFRLGARWRVDMPALADRREIVVPAQPGLGSAEVPALVLEPEGATAGAILFVHGGGWAFGSPASHERHARLIAIGSRLPVVSVDYRLAPEFPFPSGLVDVVAAFRALLADPGRFGVREGPIVVAGDSAGANLALAATLHEIEAGRPLPAGALLFYAVLDDDFETPSHRAFGVGYNLTSAKMRRYWDWYTPDPADRSNPLAAPLKADDEMLRRLPPLHLLAAEIDPLASDTLRLADRLRALGRDDALRVEPGVVHGFLQMTVALPAAREATERAAAAARMFVDQAVQQQGGE